jgi:hypothetical protein
MPLDQISVIPLTDDDLTRWSFAHMANHLDIIRRIYETTTPVPPATTPAPISLNPYPLDPVDIRNLGVWLYNHAVMHTQMDLVLGIDGYDLLDLDWNDKDQLIEWINFNSDEHIQASRILGIA